MSVNIHANRYTPAEEWANSISHGIGIVLSIAGLAVLASFSSLLGTAWHIVGCTIYGATQILLYTTSTLYHSIPIERVKKLLRTLDHSAIFLLNASQKPVTNHSLSLAKERIGTNNFREAIV
ncbi:MAG: hemolysin III family protein [Anaerolineales bacterium]|nr:MAG: hemolysin III family protein [Anaerolineales bacterium]